MGYGGGWLGMAAMVRYGDKQLDTVRDSEIFYYMVREPWPVCGVLCVEGEIPWTPIRSAPDRSGASQ